MSAPVIPPVTPPVVEWFTIEPQNFQWTESGGVLQTNVSFAIYNLKADSAAEMMVKARDALPDMGTNFNTQFLQTSERTATATMQGVTFNGNTTNAVSGTALFTTATGLEPSTMIITIDSRTVSIATNMGPDGTLIKASFKDDLDDDVPSIPEDFITCGVRVPLTAVIVEGLKYGSPTIAAEQYVGYVIGNTFRLRPGGSWLVDSAVSAYTVYQGKTSYRIVLLGAPGGKKWWVSGILRSSMTGKFAYYDGMESDIKALLAGQYSYGEQAAEFNGFSVFGYYYTVNSSTLELP